MKVHTVSLPYRSGHTCRFVLTGDIHYGSEQCDVPLLKKMVDKYAGKDNTYVMLMGDEIDAIASNDKRFDIGAVAKQYRGERNRIDLMVDDLADILSPLKGQIIAGVDSNHTSSYRNSGSDSCTHFRLSEKLGFERLGYGGWVCILWKWHLGAGHGRSTIFHITHGKPSGTMYPGTSVTAIWRDSSSFSCDIMAHGHTHQLSAGHSRIFFEPDVRHKTYRKRVQHLLQTGSYLKSYSMTEESPYSEVRRYNPVHMGWVVVDVTFEGRNNVPSIQTSVKEY